MMNIKLLSLGFIASIAIDQGAQGIDLNNLDGDSPSKPPLRTVSVRTSPPRHTSRDNISAVTTRPKAAGLTASTRPSRRGSPGTQTLPTTPPFTFSSTQQPTSYRRGPTDFSFSKSKSRLEKDKRTVLSQGQRIYDLYLAPQGSTEMEIKWSSGKDLNCFFYSIIREDEALLTTVLEDAALAKKLLETPESGGRRDFGPVRRKFYQDILAHLDRLIPIEDINNRADQQPTIRDILQQYVFIEEDRGKNIDLKSLYSLHTLHDIFAVIFANLYKVPVHVMCPMNTNAVRWVPSQDTIMETTVSASFAEMRGQDPIFIYHEGVGGIHYSKLNIITPNQASTSSSETTPLHTPREGDSGCSSLQSNPKNPDETDSIGMIKALMDSLLVNGTQITFKNFLELGFDREDILKAGVKPAH
ncbi:MAG: hypothetical protein K2Y18_06915 [Alphaproteobacteria bacterium]|jgi:hypothetical protein|nr:hypothetical protein [Alphaproteobacteria bacterium]